MFWQFLDFMIQELTFRFVDLNPAICHHTSRTQNIWRWRYNEYDWTIHTDALFTVNYDNLPMPTFPDAEVEWFRAEWMGKRPASFHELYMVVVCNCIAKSHPYTSRFLPSLINVYLIWGVIHSSHIRFCLCSITLSSMMKPQLCNEITKKWQVCGCDKMLARVARALLTCFYERLSLMVDSTVATVESTCSNMGNIVTKRCNRLAHKS